MGVSVDKVQRERGREEFESKMKGVRRRRLRMDVTSSCCYGGGEGERPLVGAQLDLSEWVLKELNFVNEERKGFRGDIRLLSFIQRVLLSSLLSPCHEIESSSVQSCPASMNGIYRKK